MRKNQSSKNFKFDSINHFKLSNIPPSAMSELLLFPDSSSEYFLLTQEDKEAELDGTQKNRKK